MMIGKRQCCEREEGATTPNSNKNTYVGTGALTKRVNVMLRSRVLQWKNRLQLQKDTQQQQQQQQQQHNTTKNVTSGRTVRLKVVTGTGPTLWISKHCRCVSPIPIPYVKQTKIYMVKEEEEEEEEDPPAKPHTYLE